MDETPVPGPSRTRGRQVLHLLWRSLKLEYHGWVSIGRFVVRHRGVPRDGLGFAYHRPSMPGLIVFLVISAVELVVVDVLVRDWPAVRIALFLLGLWGLLYMCGMLFGLMTRPHVVTPRGLHLRQGPEITLPLDWADIHTITRRAVDTNGEKAHRVTRDAEGRVRLNLWVNQQATMVVELAEPREFRLPGRNVTTDLIRFHVDDPGAFMKAVRAKLDEASSPPRPCSR